MPTRISVTTGGSTATIEVSTGARGPAGSGGDGGAVTSVAGRTGAVTLASADITDATDAATASKIVKRNGSGAASFASLTLGTHTLTPIGTGGHSINLPEASGTMWLGSMFSAFGLAWAQSTTFTAPSASGTLALTANSSGVPDALTNGTITNYTEAVVAIGNSSTAQTLALTNGTVQTCTLTGNCTFTLPTATEGKSFVLYLKTGTGSFTGTFTGVKWPGGTTPTITTTASRMDILTFVADGTNWYGQISQNYTP